jgi:hypothetical protein
MHAAPGFMFVMILYDAHLRMCLLSRRKLHSVVAAMITALRTNKTVTAVNTSSLLPKYFHVPADLVAMWDGTAPLCAFHGEFQFAQFTNLPGFSDHADCKKSEWLVQPGAQQSIVANRPRQRLLLAVLFARGFDSEGRRIVLSTRGIAQTLILYVQCALAVAYKIIPHSASCVPNRFVHMAQVPDLAFSHDLMEQVREALHHLCVIPQFGLGAALTHLPGHTRAKWR